MKREFPNGILLRYSGKACTPAYFCGDHTILRIRQILHRTSPDFSIVATVGPEKHCDDCLREREAA